MNQIIGGRQAQTQTPARREGIVAPTRQSLSYEAAEAIRRQQAGMQSDVRPF